MYRQTFVNYETQRLNFLVGDKKSRQWVLQLSSFEMSMGCLTKKVTDRWDYKDNPKLLLTY